MKNWTVTDNNDSDSHLDIYRIRQNIRGGKLSRFGQQMVIRGKTFAVQTLS